MRTTTCFIASALSLMIVSCNSDTSTGPAVQEPPDAAADTNKVTPPSTQDVDAGSTEDATRGDSATDAHGDATETPDATPDAARLPDVPYVYASDETGTVYVYSLDETSGKVQLIDKLNVGGNASFMAVDSSRTHLYAVLEDKGQLASFSIDKTTGKLTKLNQVPSGGDNPTHISVAGKWIMVAHYQEPNGDVAIFGTDASGKLMEPASDRQSPGKWSHAIVPNRSLDKVYVPCKGTDSIATYDFDTTNGKLVNALGTKAAKGSGPRHIDFHPNGQYAYVVNELDITVASYKIDSAKGLIAHGTPVSILPPATAIKNQSAAEVIVAPSGRFVYGSNRGAFSTNRDEDTVAIIPIQADGTLGTPAFQKTGGHVPRRFSLDPDGKYLAVANQFSKNLVTFRVNASTGALTRLEVVPLADKTHYVQIVRLPRP